jgi:hypothetical protein
VSVRGIVSESDHPASLRVAPPEREGRLGDHAPKRATAIILTFLVVGQLVGVIVFGAITAVRFPIWSPIDEGTHFEYVQYIAQHGDLPVLGKVYSPLADLEAGKGFSTKAFGTSNPKKMGLEGLVYEAFQPPLYYMTAVPFYDLGNTIHSRAIWLRFYGFALYLFTILLFARLCRLVLRRLWLVGMAAGMVAFFIPGMLLRAVTISNFALTLPLAMLIATELFIAWDRNAALRLVSAGVLAGLGVLTNLYLLEFLPALAIVAIAMAWRQRSARPLGLGAIGGAAAGLLIAPWLLFNEVHFRALTSSAVAKREQQPIINPHHIHYTIGMLPNETVIALLRPVLPQEWGSNLNSAPFLSFLAGLLGAVITVGSLLFICALGRRLLNTGIWVVAIPWILNILLIFYIDVGQQWEAGAALPRYMYATLPVFVIGGIGAACLQLRRLAPIVLTTLVFAVFVFGLWFRLLPIIHTS